MSRIYFRQGTAARWTDRNTVLALGEPGYETDTRKLKIGDGVLAWRDLGYWGGGETVVPSDGSSSGPTEQQVSAAIQTAIQNLHLGTAATHAAEDFEPAGAAATVGNQVAGAATAYADQQIADLHLGTAATHAASDFETAGAAAQQISALNLGSASTHAATDFDPAGAGAAAIASGLAVTRCFPKNVTTLPPLPGVLTLAEGAFGYYVDEMPVVSDGHTAWMVSGSLYNNALDLPSSPYYADNRAYGLPFILPFDLDNEVWLDPIPIPNPTWNQTPRWVIYREGQDQSFVGLTRTYVTAGTSGGTVPPLPPVTPPGWTWQWQDQSGTVLTAGTVFPDPGSVIAIRLFLRLSAPREVVNGESRGPVAPPDYTADGWVLGQTDDPYYGPSFAEAQGIWGAEGMFAGLIGRKIYFGGGDGDMQFASTLLASYDLDTGEFDWTLPRLPNGRQADYNPYAVADGKLWVSAYLDNSEDTALCSFDPATGVWTVHAGTVPTQGMTDQMQGVQVGRKILWPVDSYDYGQISYNIDTDTWDTSAATLGFNQHPAAVAVAPGGDIWVVGGLFDGPTSTVSVMTRIIAPDGTVTSPGPLDVRFDGPVASRDDVRYGVLPLPDGTFAAREYLGLALRASDGKPFLFGGTTVKTAAIETRHLPYLHANSTVPLGDGATEAFTVAPLPADPTRLAVVQPGGGAAAVQMVGDPPIPGLAIDHFADTTRFRAASDDGRPHSNSAAFQLTVDGPAVSSPAGAAHVDVSVYDNQGVVGQSSTYMTAQGPYGYGASYLSQSVNPDGTGGSASQAGLDQSAGGSDGFTTSTVASQVLGNNQGELSRVEMWAHSADSQHHTFAGLVAGRGAGNPSRGAYLYLHSDEAPAGVLLTGVNGGAQGEYAFSFRDSDSGQLMFAVHPNGDVESYSGGTILHAPNGSRHRIKVANDGSLSTEVVS